ncbi:MAG: hypothetical protein ACTHU0_29990, partial [Kofleriaceae bacterium]
MGELPVKLGAMEAVPPALRHRVAEAARSLPGDGRPLDQVAAARLARLIEDGAPHLGAERSLAELGAWMVDPARGVELRRLGCAWLGLFPSVESIRRLAAIALDPATPAPVRERAIESLGDRQLRARHPDTRWPVEAVQLADEALVKLADAATLAGKVASEQLPHALRHVQAEALAAVFARAPGLWGEALECFATAPLARVLVVSIDDVAPAHRMRALRLIAATLGEEAVPLLLARAARSPHDERIEMLMLAIGSGGERHLPRLEAAIAGTRSAEAHRARARWHLANPGIVPTVRGLRVARATAVIAPVDRAARCARAADDLGALVPFARHAEAYLYGLWAWMVRGAGDPVRAAAVVGAHADAEAVLGELHLEQLARRGRVGALVEAARRLDRPDLGALQLGIWGRPLAALELAAMATRHTPELVCARALACHRAGRPDLTARVLAEDLPPAEPVSGAPVGFPGPDEQWWIARAAHRRPAIAALAGGAAAVIALARPAPDDAEPDHGSLAPIAAVARRLDRRVDGATV